MLGRVKEVCHFISNRLDMKLANEEPILERSEATIRPLIFDGIVDIETPKLHVYRADDLPADELFANSPNCSVVSDG
jgi:hypothetical protein